MKAVAIFSCITATLPAVYSLAVVEREVSQEAAFPYEFGKVTWTGPLEKGGLNVSFSGNYLEEIDAQIQAKHPGLSIFDGSLDFDDAPSEAPVASEQGLERRDSTNCGANFGTPVASDINSGINHLRTVTGGCSVRARQCIRTTCNNNAAIVLCNDRYSDLTISCNQVADMAKTLVSECYSFNPCDNNCNRPGCVPAPCTGGRVQGQRFSDNFNVITSTCDRFSAGGQPV